MNHRKTFAGKAKRRRWTPLDALYFFGYALLHYHSTPYTLGDAAFIGVKQIRTKGEDLTAIELEFAPELHTHCRTQTFYFGREALVRRHDYVADVVGAYARGCHFWDDYEMVDGFMFPVRRKVTARLFGRPLPFVVLDARFSAFRVELRAPD